MPEIRMKVLPDLGDGTVVLEHGIGRFLGPRGRSTLRIGAAAWRPHEVTIDAGAAGCNVDCVPQLADR